jgi:glycosyltransferase involved in cell wall biosynthesis
MRVLHVIPHLAQGGAYRTLEETVRRLINAGARQSVLSLAEGSTKVRQRLSSLGVSTFDRSDLAEADVVLVYFWNTPAMHRFLRAPHPPMRVVVWLLVEGGTRPHVVTPELAAFADTFLTMSSSSLELPQVKSRRGIYLPSLIDFSEFTPRHPVKETPFIVGYLGTVDFCKMHPDYVAMSAAVPDEEISFDVWGPGGAYSTLRAEAARLGQEHRFRFHGPTQNTAAAFASMHVCGYPLCEDNYGTNDRAIQEAMSMCLPCVVIDRPGLRDLAIDGVTALVAKSARDYTSALMHLKHDRGLRWRLGQSAADHVRLQFDPVMSINRLCKTLEDALSLPKRDRRALDGGAPITGARLFVASLGSLAGEYARSLRSIENGDAVDGKVLDDEDAIAAATRGLCNPGAGGVLAYRAAYPDDPVLRFWCGLIFSRQGRHAVALAEFLAALRFGLSRERLQPYVTTEARHCGLSDSAASLQ